MSTFSLCVNDDSRYLQPRYIASILTERGHVLEISYGYDNDWLWLLVNWVCRAFFRTQNSTLLWTNRSSLPPVTARALAGAYSLRLVQVAPNNSAITPSKPDFVGWYVARMSNLGSHRRLLGTTCSLRRWPTWTAKSVIFIESMQGGSRC